MNGEGGASLQAVVVTGLSGSGKSTVVHALEDLGFFCIDNLPVVLLPNVLELFRKPDSKAERVAVGADVRSRGFFVELPRAVAELRAQGVQLTVVFLDATDQAIVRRYAQTRRPHPLDPGDVLEGIRRERALLKAVRELADFTVDTTNLNLIQLGELVRERFSSERDPGRRMHVTFQSFGFTGGVPFDADVVLDARFIPNPYYVEALRPLTGLDAEVQRYIHEQEATGEFLERLREFLGYLLPQYGRVGKSYLTVAVGCTGGQHRSVAIVEWLRERFAAAYAVTVKHRDLPAAAGKAAG